jgi:hypothetical protein
VGQSRNGKDKETIRMKTLTQEKLKDMTMEELNDLENRLWKEYKKVSNYIKYILSFEEE